MLLFLFQRLDDSNIFEQKKSIHKPCQSSLDVCIQTTHQKLGFYSKENNMVLLKQLYWTTHAFPILTQGHTSFMATHKNDDKHSLRAKSITSHWCSERMRRKPMILQPQKKHVNSVAEQSQSSQLFNYINWAMPK